MEREKIWNKDTIERYQMINHGQVPEPDDWNDVPKREAFEDALNSKLTPLNREPDFIELVGLIESSPWLQLCTDPEERSGKNLHEICVYSLVPGHGRFVGKLRWPQYTSSGDDHLVTDDDILEMLGFDYMLGHLAGVAYRDAVKRE